MIERDAYARGNFLVLRGKGTAPGLACGPLRRNSPGLSREDAEGAILVAERAVPDDVGRILASAGTLTLSGSLLSHVSLLSREFGKPSVSLGAACPSRILPADSGEELLELLDVVGGAEKRAVLREGDVAMIDGSSGKVGIPGGLDEDARLAIRKAHAALRELIGGPDDPAAMRALVDLASTHGPLVVAYLMEASVLYRVLPAGPVARGLIAALRASPSVGPEAAACVADLRERTVASARSRCEEALAALPLHDDLDALDRAARSLREAVRTDLDRLEDLAVDPAALAGILDPALAEAGRRRDELTARLGADVEGAEAWPDATLRSRLGGLLGLARRARAAGIAHDALARLESRLARVVACERESTGTSLVVPLADETPADRAVVGGKAAGLLAVREALPAGCTIPRGFVVTTAAYRLHLLGERGERLREAVRECRDPAALSRRARAILLSGEILDDVLRPVETALEQLGPSRLAVRSSATIEDGPEGSLAGLFDSWLGVDGLDELMHRIRLAWASLWNARALRAMGALGISPLEASQAVLVQEAIETRSAGVLLTQDPSGDAGTLLVNAAWGLGEAISQGEVEGDVYRVRRGTGKIVAAESGAAATFLALDPAGTGTVEAPLPPDRVGRPCLDGEELSLLAALAAALEAATGRAQDVEFGVDGEGRVAVFQVRRIVPDPARG
jgi:pyruvate, water dikinase